MCYREKKVGLIYHIYLCHLFILRTQYKTYKKMATETYLGSLAFVRAMQWRNVVQFSRRDQEIAHSWVSV